jgi:hypothetical protein
MESDHSVPRWKLHDIPLHHPFITLQKIGIVRRDMAVAIIQHDFNTHLMGDIGDGRGPNMRDFDLSCQPKIALDKKR